MIYPDSLKNKYLVIIDSGLSELDTEICDRLALVYPDYKKISHNIIIICSDDTNSSNIRSELKKIVSIKIKIMIIRLKTNDITWCLPKSISEWVNKK